MTKRNSVCGFCWFLYSCTFLPESHLCLCHCYSPCLSLMSRPCGPEALLALLQAHRRTDSSHLCQSLLLYQGDNENTDQICHKSHRNICNFTQAICKYIESKKIHSQLQTNNESCSAYLDSQLKKTGELLLLVSQFIWSISSSSFSCVHLSSSLYTGDKC